MKHRAFIALGSNLGDRANILQRATQLLAESRVELIKQSSVIETEPVGFDSPHPFLNQVIEVATDLSPLELLRVTQEVESKLGRTLKSTDGCYNDRTCDLDIILYDQLQSRLEGLTIPHPRFRERRFVLAPLAEIAPETVDPVTGNTIRELLWDVS